MPALALLQETHGPSVNCPSLLPAALAPPPSKPLNEPRIGGIAHVLSLAGMDSMPPASMPCMPPPNPCGSSATGGLPSGSLPADAAQALPAPALGPIQRANSLAATLDITAKSSSGLLGASSGGCSSACGVDGISDLHSESGHSSMRGSHGSGSFDSSGLHFPLADAKAPGRSATAPGMCAGPATTLNATTAPLASLLQDARPGLGLPSFTGQTAPFHAPPIGYGKQPHQLPGTYGMGLGAHKSSAPRPQPQLPFMPNENMGSMHTAAAAAAVTSSAPGMNPYYTQALAAQLQVQQVQQQYMHALSVMADARQNMAMAANMGRMQVGPNPYAAAGMYGGMGSPMPAGPSPSDFNSMFLMMQNAALAPSHV